MRSKAIRLFLHVLKPFPAFEGVRVLPKSISQAGPAIPLPLTRKSAHARKAGNRACKHLAAILVTIPGACRFRLLREAVYIMHQ
jgi:hypothetical protein